MRLPLQAYCLALILTASPAYGDVLDDARQETNSPGATAAVYQCGHRVWASASGVKSRTTRKRTRVRTRFVLASVTKPVTATMILQLVEQGRLSLGDRLSSFYPRLPNARRITIRHLLSHTSGLREYDYVQRRPKYPWTRDEVLDGIGSPRFRPGSRYEYSNSNYVVLGGILEQVTGSRVSSIFERRVAGPANMRRSTFLYRPRRSRTIAEAYLPSGRSSWAGNVIPSDVWGDVWTDGGLAATAPDIARFLHGLFHGRLISKKTLGTMTSVGRFNYGLGLYSKRHRGRRWLGHDGWYGGYEAEVWHDAKRDLTISVLVNGAEPSNASYQNSDRIWKAVAASYARLSADCEA